MEGVHLDPVNLKSNVTEIVNDNPLNILSANLTTQLLNSKIGYVTNSKSEILACLRECVKEKIRANSSCCTSNETLHDSGSNLSNSAPADQQESEKECEICSTTSEAHNSCASSTSSVCEVPLTPQIRGMSLRNGTQLSSPCLPTPSQTKRVTRSANTTPLATPVQNTVSNNRKRTMQSSGLASTDTNRKNKENRKSLPNLQSASAGTTSEGSSSSVQRATRSANTVPLTTPVQNTVSSNRKRTMQSSGLAGTETMRKNKENRKSLPNLRSASAGTSSEGSSLSVQDDHCAWINAVKQTVLEKMALDANSEELSTSIKKKTSNLVEKCIAGPSHIQSKNSPAEEIEEECSERTLRNGKELPDFYCTKPAKTTRPCDCDHDFTLVPGRPRKRTSIVLDPPMRKRNRGYPTCRDRQHKNEFHICKPLATVLGLQKTTYRSALNIFRQVLRSRKVAGMGCCVYYLDNELREILGCDVIMHKDIHGYLGSHIRLAS